MVRLAIARRYRGAAVVSLSRVPCCVVPVHWARRTVPALTRVPRGDQPLNLGELACVSRRVHGQPQTVGAVTVVHGCDVVGGWSLPMLRKRKGPCS